MEQRFARHLDLGFVIDTRQLDSARIGYTDLHKGCHRLPDPALCDPRFIEWLDTLELEIMHTEIFYARPGAFTPIHVDGYVHDDHCKINWVFGAEGSEMIWWSPKKGTDGKPSTTTVSTNALRYDPSDVDFVYSCGVGLPTLLNVGRPHNVRNSTGDQRWCVSYTIRDLRTGKKLYWDDACDRLKPWFSGGPDY